MSIKQNFRAVIENAGSGGAYVRIPFDVEKIYGKKRVPVKVTINGEPYRGTIVRMGEPWHILIVLKEIREKIGKTFGDEVEVILEEDNEPRVVELPMDFRKALDNDPVAKTAYEKLSYTHQREYMRAILDAKHEETRRSRIEKSIEMLKKAKEK
jgi:hypothetical protein